MTIDKRLSSLLKVYKTSLNELQPVNQNSNRPAEVLRKRRLGKTELVVLSCISCKVAWYRGLEYTKKLKQIF